MNKKRRAISLLGSLCTPIVFTALVSSSVLAQVITGRIVQVDSEVPVAAAAVRLLNDLGQVVGHTTSSSAGTFVLNAPRAGRFQIGVEALGHTAMTTDPVEVPQADTVRLELYLPSDPIQLPALRILSKRQPVNERLARRRFYEFQELYERKMGTGRFFTPETIDSLRHPPLSRLVQGLPNYRVVSLGGTRVDIRLRNGGRPTLYIDGVRVRLREETFDQLIAPGDIGAVEVYWGANPRSPGPVIMVWTRMW